MLDRDIREELVNGIERGQVSFLHRALDRAWDLGYTTAKQEVSMSAHDRFTEEALKAQDGKKVPLTQEIGGPIVGEATLRYNPRTGELVADMRIDDPQVAEVLSPETSVSIFKKES